MARAQQEFLTEEMKPEHQRIQEIVDAAQSYVAARDARMSLTKDEVSRRETLRELMKKHELMKYEFEDHVVERLPGKEKIKVRTVDNDPPEEGEDEAEETA